MRTVKDVARRQHAKEINALATSLAKHQHRPGWIERFRSALGMSITDVADRANLDRSVVSRAEQREKDGNITIQQIEKLAAAMGGKFVYAIVPQQGTVEDIILEQARKRAKPIVKRTRAQMALEAQSEGLESEEAAVEELATELARARTRGFWR